MNANPSADASSDASEAYDRLPDAVTEIFGEEATAEFAYDLLTVDVPAASWTAALETARDRLGLSYFDWLSAVDEPGTGFRVCAHLAAPRAGTVRSLMVRTTVPHDAPSLATAIGVYAGADWHERETHEMFGIAFEGHPHLVPLLLPENFEGYPLRKDFVLAARVVKAWPGAKEPGESEHGGPKRRTMLPPGVPDPNEWGPLKGQLPPAPARPARAARPAGDRPVRRARTAGEGEATETAARRPRTEAEPTESATPTGPVRRSRSVSQGSASQQPAPTTPDTTPAEPAPDTTPAEPAPDTTPAEPAPRPSRSPDAPWHNVAPEAPESARPSAGEGEGKGKGEGEDKAAAPTDKPAAPTEQPDTTPTPPPAPEPEADPDRPAGGDTA
ncbi:NADH-quinone oxidoreductase subunit C [Streptomyces sp. NBC_00234]|uniref:NADH-quinone oxidoreductase subunit C n=1 Tax=Streptomyces sp. NBC_00234 TaxID=2903638 RepID=UPI002E2C3D48|nr:NADH-quinone oxidoreductase subunit C [Streptomyces sp. NBC_00234]